MLVKDSNYSDWIYVVRSGSVFVLKKLAGVKKTVRGHAHRMYISFSQSINDKFVTFEEKKICSRVGKRLKLNEFLKFICIR